MLHPLYLLRRGIDAEYNGQACREAVEEFLDTLPDGRATYYQAVRHGMGYLYAQALAVSGKDFFLDKTPRYYQVIAELVHVFPRCRIIILLRNPLAVLCSILNTWVKRRLRRLGDFRSDLLNAPNLLLQGIEQIGSQCTVIRYEDLVTDPAGELKKLCDFLEMDFAEEMIDYGRSQPIHWRYGDQTLARSQVRPLPDNARRWEHELAKPQTWRLANDYIRLLGKNTLVELGYDDRHLRDVLAKRRPSFLRRCGTASLDRLLRFPRFARRANVKNSEPHPNCYQLVPAAEPLKFLSKAA